MRSRAIVDVEIIDIRVGVIGAQANRRLFGVGPRLSDVLARLPYRRRHLDGPPAIIVRDAVDAVASKRSKAVAVVAVVGHGETDVRGVEGDDLEADHQVVRTL